MTGSLRNTTAVGIAGLLTAAPLVQLTADARFFAIVVVAVFVLQAAAALVRRATQQPWLPALTQSVLLVVGLGVAAGAIAGPAPGGQFWRPIRLVFDEAAAHIAEQSAPMAANDPTLLVLVAGSAILAMVIDLAFITARSVLLAALPILGGYITASVVLDHPVQMGSLVAVSTGWLVLLASRTIDHEHRWPRGLRRETGAKLNLQGFFSLAFGLGVPAIVLALVAGLAIPSTSGEPWSPGSGGAMQLVDPNIELNENLRLPADRPVISYTTTAADGVMLRSTTLTVVDANGWHQIDMDLQRGFPNRIPGVLGLEPTDFTQVSVGEFASTYLPVPYAPLRWDAAGLWAFDPATLTVLNADRETGPQALANLNYTVDSHIVEPTAQQVAAAVAGTPPEGTVAVEVPAGVPTVIADLARQITAEADTDGRKAIALQDWLRDPERFSYTLDAPPGAGYDSLVNFLTRDFAGYCVHFAGSMALMARVVGIPARVSVGFTPGTRQADGSWLVSSHDMHAWPELYFSGLGWVRFEPTVSVAAPPSWTEVSEPDAEPTPEAEPTPGFEASPTPQAPEPSAEPTEGPGTPTSGRAIDPAWLPGILGVMLLLAAPGLFRLGLRRSRLQATGSSEQVSGAWRELRATAVDLGLGWPEATPRQIAEAPWPGLDAEGRAALRRVCLLVERLHYSPGLPEQLEVADDVALVAGQWLIGVSGWTRVWTRLVPRSLGMDVRWPWRDQAQNTSPS